MINFDSTMLKDQKNPKNHTCILFIENLKKSLEISNIESLNHVNTTMLNENIKENVKIENENDLLNFYIENNIDGKIKNKSETSKLTGLHIEKIRRLNKKLKDRGKIKSIGKNIFLENKKEGVK